MPLAAMLASLSANLPAHQRARVYILQRQLPAALRRRIEQSVDPGKVDIDWIDIGPSELCSLGGTLRSFDTVSLESYYRLLLPRVLPASLDRVIYLDSDLVVTGDLSELWELDVGSTSLFAVPELVAASSLVSSQAGISLYRELGLPPGLKLFNSGVMLINLERWRRERVALRAMIYLEVARDHLRWHDQEALNAVLAGDWRELDPRWNVTMHLFRTRVRSAQIQESLQTPSIVHFNSAIKPWQPGFPFGFLEEFFHYLDMTPWSGWRPASAQSLGVKLRNKLRRAAKKRYHTISSRVRVTRVKLSNERLLRRRVARIGSNRIPPETDDELRVFVNVTGPLPACERLIKYYEELGADRIFLLVGEDCASEATELGGGGGKLHVISKAGADDFSAHVVLRSLLDRYAQRCWSVVMDSNERFHFGGAEIDTLKDVCRRLEEKCFGAAAARVIYSGSPLPETLLRRTVRTRFPQADDCLAIDTVARDPVTLRIFPARLLVDAHQDDFDGPIAYRSKVAVLRFEKGVSIADGFRAVHGLRMEQISAAIPESESAFQMSIIRYAMGHSAF